MWREQTSGSQAAAASAAAARLDYGIAAAVAAGARARTGRRPGRAAPRGRYPLRKYRRDQPELAAETGIFRLRQRGPQPSRQIGAGRERRSLEEVRHLGVDH